MLRLLGNLSNAFGLGTVGIVFIQTVPSRCLQERLQSDQPKIFGWPLCSDPSWRRKRHGRAVRRLCTSRRLVHSHGVATTPSGTIKPPAWSCYDSPWRQVVKKMEDWTPIATEYDSLKAGSIDGTDEEPHDRAVLRAMLSRYVPNKGVVGDPHLMLFVARLSQQTTEEKLKEFFSRYGDIQRIRLVRDVVTGFSKGYAFIEFKQENAIKKAYRDANKLVIDQHEIFVDYELERLLKGWVPRRLGGGLGGKKESGQLRYGGRDRPFRKPINLPDYPINVRSEGHVDNRYRSRSRERIQEWREKKMDYSRDRGRNDRWQDRSQNRHNRKQIEERQCKVERSRDRERSEKVRRGPDHKRDRSRERDFRK